MTPTQKESPVTAATVPGIESNPFEKEEEIVSTISQDPDLSTSEGIRRFAFTLLAKADDRDIANGVLTFPVPESPPPFPDGEEFPWSECCVDPRGDIVVTDGTSDYTWQIDVGRIDLATVEAAEDFVIFLARAARIMGQQESAVTI